jgi:hypothetical protein
LGGGNDLEQCPPASGKPRRPLPEGLFGNGRPELEGKHFLKKVRGRDDPHLPSPPGKIILKPRPGVLL